MKINRIIETVIYCDNVEEMFDFYQDLFKFEVIQKSFPRGVFMRCGESILAIFDRSMTSQEGQLPPHHGATGAQHFAFEIPDDEYEEWKKFFLEKGISIEQEITWKSRNNGARSFYFRDPAGNNVEMTEKKLWDSAGFDFDKK